MTTETTTATETIEAAKATTSKPTAKKSVKSTKPAKKAAKSTKPAKKAAKSTKPAKKAAKKVVTKQIVTEPRASSIFKLTAKKFDAESFGAGQRAAIAKILNKTGGATRTTIAAKLPDVSLTNISWHLSMMVKDKTVKRTAA
jgi:hypothetical protein